MFVKITNGQVEKYPYTIGSLRKDHPNVSFPCKLTDDTLVTYGVYRVKEAPEPDYNTRTHRLVTQDPALVNGVWTVSRVAVEKDQAQIDNETEQKAASVRAERNSKLTDSDWTQVADAPVNKAAWATYRQALRDVTAQEGFPNEITWPTKPE